MRKENLLTQRFHKLIVIEELQSNNKNKRPRWKCLCDCGETIIVSRGCALKSGNTKSCGCIRAEKSSKRLSLIAAARKIYEPKIALAREVFKKRYDDGDLIFDDFFKLSQMNCHYCGKIPSNTKSGIRKDRCKEFNDTKYIYNGVDRVNNNLPHNYDNCVPCCKECNMSKRNMTLHEFKTMIKNIILFKNNVFQNYQQLFSINKEDLSRFKRIKGQLHRYKDIDFSFELLSFILTKNCFYCNSTLSNKAKCKNGDIISYNGLDRIDQNKDHSLNNIVPCCKQCNMSKGKRSYGEFISWAERVYNFI